MSGKPSTYPVAADGKMMFEGMLTVACAGKKTRWDAVEGYEHTNAVEMVSADAVDNVIQLACRM